MGINVEINRRSVDQEGYFEYLYRLTNTFIENIQKFTKITSESFRIQVFNPFKGITYAGGKNLKKWSEYKRIFGELFEHFKRKRACLQILSTLEMEDPLQNKKIQVCFEIFMNGNLDSLSFRKFGHWSFDLTGYSSDFPYAVNEYNFNDFFIRDETGKNRWNLRLLRKLITRIEWFNKDFKRIKRINVGDDSFPWINLHRAIYIYRLDLKTFQNDLFANIDLIRKEINDPTILLSSSEREKLNRIWGDNLLIKIKRGSLLEEMQKFDRTYRFLPEFFKIDAVAATGSFRLYKNSFTPLYNIIEKFYESIKETIEDVAPSWEDLWKKFIDAWNKKQPSLRKHILES